MWSRSVFLPKEMEKQCGPIYLFLDPIIFHDNDTLPIQPNAISVLLTYAIKCICLNNLVSNSEVTS